MMLVSNQQKLFNFFNESAFHCNIINCSKQSFQGANTDRKGKPCELLLKELGKEKLCYRRTRHTSAQFRSSHNSITAMVAQHKWS